MVGEVFFSGELLPAVGALVGSFTGVQSDVVREVFLAGERFATVRAAVRRLAGVLAHVVRQVLLPGEALGAVAALERGLTLRMLLAATAAATAAPDVVQFTVTVATAGGRSVGSG